MNNQEIFPRFYRNLVWAIFFAVFALIALTGYIAIQIAEIDREVNELRQTI